MKFNKKYFKEWLPKALIRAVKTMSQTAIATLSTSKVICEVNWQLVVSSTILSGILSLLTSITGLPEITESEG